MPVQDEEGPPDPDGRMLTARGKRLRAEAAVVVTGGLFEDTVAAAAGLKKFLLKRAHIVVDNVVPAATESPPSWSEFITKYSGHIAGKLPTGMRCTTGLEDGLLVTMGVQRCACALTGRYRHDRGCGIPGRLQGTVQR